MWGWWRLSSCTAATWWPLLIAQCLCRILHTHSSRISHTTFHIVKPNLPMKLCWKSETNIRWRLLFLGCWFNQSEKPNKIRKKKSENEAESTSLRKLLKVGESCRLFARLISSAALACRGLEKAHLGETPGGAQHWRSVAVPVWEVRPVSWRSACVYKLWARSMLVLLLVLPHTRAAAALSQSVRLDLQLHLLNSGGSTAPRTLSQRWTDSNRSQEWRHRIFFFLQDLASFRKHLLALSLKTFITRAPSPQHARTHAP